MKSMKSRSNKKYNRPSLRKLIKGGYHTQMCNGCNKCASFQNAGSPASVHVNNLLDNCKPSNLGSITPQTNNDVSTVNTWKTTGGGKMNKRKNRMIKKSRKSRKSRSSYKNKKGGSPASTHVNTLLQENCELQKLPSITPETNNDVSAVNIWKTTGGGIRKKRKNRRKRSKKNKFYKKKN